ncbi:MAG: PIN domain-containing protein [Planctomycetia bacterium]|nr:PIN domain-containing protein [Planctomycetia bacterium]
MIKTLTLFPDTNIFIQCKSLTEINWSVLGDFDQVDLIVTRPVQKEIDRQKGRGTGRLARRAKAAASEFRKALKCEDETLIITKSRPEVRLRISLQLRPSEEDGLTLDYNEPDDKLVGIAKAFSDANSEASVRLLTNDFGPQASAKEVGVVCEVPRDDWFLPEERDATEKRLKALENELLRFRQAEPSISLEMDNAVKDRINGKYSIYPELSTEELDTLIRKLKLRHPKETDFSSKEEITPTIPNDKQLSILAAAKILRSIPARTFVPASEEEINKYINTNYPMWVKDCKEKLRQIHSRFQSKVEPLRLIVRLANNGSRPAENCLITFEAKGDFVIQPSPDERNSDITEDPFISSPPPAPKGRWQVFGKFIYGSIENPAFFPLGIDAISRLKSRARDDDAFYYKSGKPELPCTSYSLECVRWRHQLDSVSFSIDIYPSSLSHGHVKGAVNVTVHAANMTDSFNHLIQISVDVNTGDTFAEAMRLIEDFV